jgi:hypothetical protein
VLFFHQKTVARRKFQNLHKLTFFLLKKLLVILAVERGVRLFVSLLLRGSVIYPFISRPCRSFEEIYDGEDNRVQGSENKHRAYHCATAATRNIAENNENDYEGNEQRRVMNKQTQRHIYSVCSEYKIRYRNDKSEKQDQHKRTDPQSRFGKIGNKRKQEEQRNDQYRVAARLKNKFFNCFHWSLRTR